MLFCCFLLLRLTYFLLPSVHAHEKKRAFHVFTGCLKKIIFLILYLETPAPCHCQLTHSQDATLVGTRPSLPGARLVRALINLLTANHKIDHYLQWSMNWLFFTLVAAFMSCSFDMKIETWLKPRQRTGSHLQRVDCSNCRYLTCSESSWRGVFPKAWKYRVCLQCPIRRSRKNCLFAGDRSTTYTSFTPVTGSQILEN